MLDRASFSDIVQVTFESVGRGTKVVVSVKGTKNNAREVRDYVASVAGVKPLKIEW